MKKVVNEKQEYKKIESMIEQAKKEVTEFVNKNIKGESLLQRQNT